MIFKAKITHGEFKGTDTKLYLVKKIVSNNKIDSVLKAKINQNKNKKLIK